MLPNSFHELREPRPFTLELDAPANIAWVKYWGKLKGQLPTNPSLSMTLQKSTTHMKAIVVPASELAVSVLFEGEERPSFARKIHGVLAKLSADLPVLAKTQWTLITENTFPHSAGIASSASSMAALGAILARFLAELSGEVATLEQASFLARLASGSACRSLYGGFVSWGETPALLGSSDLHATALKVHENFQHARDAILIVSKEEKEISSSQGHAQMGLHPYAEARYADARAQHTRLLDVLRSGDWTAAGEILEAEALTLHAMMMTSRPGFMLLRPQSLDIIRLVRLFRQDTQVPVYFTIDAGPNIHLIYPDAAAPKVEAFVRHELLPHTVEGKGVIWDEVSHQDLVL